MKPEELRKGNLFEYDGKIFRVKEIRDYIIVGDRGKGDVDFTIKEISSIQLTEEWLLKFGFNEMEPSEYTYDAYSKRGIQFWNRDNKLVIEKPSVSYPLKYVHQLQNLYFALTGEELTFS